MEYLLSLNKIVCYNDAMAKKFEGNLGLPYNALEFDSLKLNHSKDRNYEKKRRSSIKL